MATTKSYGTCIFCNKEFSKARISRHLATHLARNTAGCPPGKAFHVRIENNPDDGSSLYFLDIWVDGTATFRDVDIFLRKIWLECCGHMSVFRIRMEQNTDEQSLEANGGEIPKSKIVKDIFTKGLRLEYEYDFGSTTALLITVVNEYPVSTEDKILLLSRNEPLAIMCDLCGTEPARQVCSVCLGHAESVFCEGCAGKHADTCSDFPDSEALPVVNSPRMGVCGYSGGLMSAEHERDGVYLKK